jgi:branched-chain amino acid transport system permease protein
MWLLLVFLIAFPFLVGAITGSSPLGLQRGDHYIMRGESVRWQAVLIELFILAILAMSYNLIFGFTGVVSFGHALFFGLGGYILGLALEYSGLSTGVGLIVGVIGGLVLCAVLSLLVGLVSLRLRGVYFAIFTLAIAEMAFIYFSRLQLTNAEDGFAIGDLPSWIDPSQNRLIFYYIVLALFILTFLFIQRVINSPTGAVFKAIRENEERAQAIGYNTLTFKLLSIMLAGMIAGLAGMLYIILNKKVGPEILSVTYTVNPLLMTIIGGAGTFAGPVLGAVGLHLLDTVLRDLTIQLGGTTLKIADVWGFLLGVIFIVVVLIAPQGLIGSFRRRGKSERDPGKKQPTAETQ